METKNEFFGILPAVVTPLDTEERFAPAAFERLLQRLYERGSHGVYVCGQTGEGLLQPVEQRKKVAEVAVANTPAGRQVIVHTGAYSTADALKLTRHASTIGVTAVSSLPALGCYSFAEIKGYYEALAAASDVPVLVYYFPEVCPSITSAAQILELCAIPGVAGLKFTDFDLYKLSLIKRSGAVVYNGRDEVLAAGLLMGADGGIGSSYNLIPGLFVECFEHARAGRWAEATCVQARINELIEIALQFPYFAALKTILRWSGLDCGPCLRPRRSLSADEEVRLHDLLAASSFADLLEPAGAAR